MKREKRDAERSRRQGQRVSAAGERWLWAGCWGLAARQGGKSGCGCWVQVVTMSCLGEEAKQGGGTSADRKARQGRSSTAGRKRLGEGEEVCQADPSR